MFTQSARSFIWLFLSIAACLSTVEARTNDCLAACAICYRPIKFPDVPDDSPYFVAQCGSQLKVSSICACSQAYCTLTESENGWQELRDQCLLYANISIPAWTDISSGPGLIDNKHFNRSQFDDGMKFTTAVTPDESLFESAVRSNRAWDQSEKIRMRYGEVMLYYWLFVVLMGRLCASAPETTAGSLKLLDLSRPWQHRFRQIRQRWITVPALFGKHCAQPVGYCTIPPRLESLLLLIFIFLNILLCSISYDVFSENVMLLAPQQWSRYIADRTGVISIANLPLIWLFATRNNVVLVATNWSFESAMIYHKWVARVSTLEAIVHSIAYTILVFQEGSWPHYWEQLTYRYWNMGVLATIAMTLICAVSIRPFREFSYEIFLAGHQFLGLLTLVGLWYHVEIFNGEYNCFIWPAIIVWMADRIFRLGRLTYINQLMAYSTLDYDSVPNLLRLSIPVSRRLRPKAGHYYFIYAVQGRTILESHPFTACSWKHSEEVMSGQELRFIIRPYNGFTKRLVRLCGSSISGKSKHGSTGSVRMLVEGPYGPAHNLNPYSSLTFIVGGTGIAVATAYFTDLCHSVHASQKTYNASSVRIIWAVQDIEMARSVYSSELAPVFSQLELKTSDLTPTIYLEVYVTRSNHDKPVPAPSSSELSTWSSSRFQTAASTKDMSLMPVHFGSFSDDGESHEGSPLISPPSTPTRLEGGPPLISHEFESIAGLDVSMNHGFRPDLAALVLEMCQPRKRRRSIDAEADIEDERVAIISCGPPSLSDATRTAVVEALKRGDCPHITFFNESYTW